MEKFDINSNTNFYEGFKLTLENARNHIIAATNCESISLGIANSHLILAAEEAIKSALLWQLNFDKDILNENLNFDSYFSSHKYKHKVIKNIEFFGLMIEKSVEIRIKPFESLDPNTISKNDIRKKLDEGFNSLIKWLEDLTNDVEKFDTNEEWWNQADSNKNKGLYINLLKKTGKWEGPFSIKENQYNKSKSIVTKFVNRIENIEEAFKNPNIVEHYYKMKKKYPSL